MRTRRVQALVRTAAVLASVGSLSSVGAMGAMGGVGSVAVAAARAASPEVGFRPVGRLNYVWTGDPARGCAAEGLCGVVGSLQVITGNSSASGGPGFPPIELTDDSAVTRVEEPALDGTPAACADLLPYDVQFGLRHQGGQLRAVAQASAQPPSSGRCAGPTAADLQSVVLPARKLGRRGYDLSGTVSFGAGPFAVTVVSTIHALFVSSGSPGGSSSGSVGGSSTPVPDPGPRVPRSRAVLAERADVTYRVTGVSGQLEASFAGLPPPFCAPLDGCGAAGAVSLVVLAPGVAPAPRAPPASGQTLDFSGLRLVKRRVGERRALADLRAGRLRQSDNPSTLTLAGELTGTLAGGNATPCRDAVSAPPLDLTRSNGDRLTLGSLGPAASFFGPDELRTRCPGPGSAEILGTRALAAAAVRADAVSAPRLTIVLSGAGAFHGTAYAGSRSGVITLTLVRTHASGGTRRARVIGGQVIG